jgi:hypothetical protein
MSHTRETLPGEKLREHTYNGFLVGDQTPDTVIDIVFNVSAVLLGIE